MRSRAAGCPSIIIRQSTAFFYIYLSSTSTAVKIQVTAELSLSWVDSPPATAKPPSPPPLMSAATAQDPTPDAAVTTAVTQRSRGSQSQRVRRRQSWLRLSYKRDPGVRSDDIPACPMPDDLFSSTKETVDDVGSFAAIDSEPENVDQLDPYADILNLEQNTPTTDEEGRSHRDRQHRSKPARRSLSDSEASFYSANSLQNSEESVTLGRTASNHSTSNHHHRRRHHHTTNSLSIEREIRIALVHRRKSRERRGGNGSRPSNSSLRTTGIATPSSMRSCHQGEEAPDYQSASNSFDDMEFDDDFDCFYQLWEFLVKFVALVIKTGNFVLDHKILLYPLGLFFGYLCLGMLHSIMASIMASLTGWIWPPAHLFLSTTAGFVWRLADWLMWIDELGRSVICDMAANYCRRYRLLCDRQCSFVDRAMEHAHSRRCS